MSREQSPDDRIRLGRFPSQEGSVFWMGGTRMRYTTKGECGRGVAVQNLNNFLPRPPAPAGSQNQLRPGETTQRRTKAEDGSRSDGQNLREVGREEGESDRQ